jgi:hypothetical protein
MSRRVSPSPYFTGFLVGLAAAGLLLSCSSQAAAAKVTRGERSAYAVGLVVGAYYSFIGELVERLSAAGVPDDALSDVIIRGCNRVTSEDLVREVLTEEPLPATDAEAVVQARVLMRHACASLSARGI